MSADLLVYLKRSAMPSPAQWAQAIMQAGFPVEMDTDFDVDRATGFRPCRFHGAVSGFEYYSSATSAQDRNELCVPAEYNFVVNLLAHSDHHEWETAVVAAGVLCWLSRGVLCDPQAGTEYSADEALAWAHGELARADAEASE